MIAAMAKKLLAAIEGQDAAASKSENSDIEEDLGEADKLSYSEADDKEYNDANVNSSHLPSHGMLHPLFKAIHSNVYLLSCIRQECSALLEFAPCFISADGFR